MSVLWGLLIVAEAWKKDPKPPAPNNVWWTSECIFLRKKASLFSLKRNILKLLKIIKIIKNEQWK